MGASISTVNDPNVVANGIFSSGVTVSSASFNPGHYERAAGTFTNGPLGLSTGGLLTTGRAENAAGYQTFNVDVVNNGGSSQAYCGQDSVDAVVLSVDIEVQQGFNGVEVEFVFASEEYTYHRPDPIGIYLDGQQYALNPDGTRITATSYYLAPERAIVKGNDIFAYPGWSTYAASSKPLIMGIAAAPGPHSMVFAICDSTDGHYDSGLFVRAKACKDCEADVKVHYLTQTTTTVSTFTSTIEPVSAQAGTVLIGVTAEPTATASSSEAQTSSSEVPTTASSTESTASSTEYSSSSTEASTGSTETSASSTEASSSTASASFSEASSSTESSATTTAASDSSTATTTDLTVSTTASSTDSSATTATSSDYSSSISTGTLTTTASQATTTSALDSTMTTLTTSRRPCRPR